MSQLRVVSAQRRPVLMLGLVTLALALFLCLLVGETVCRMFFPDTQLHYRSDAESLYYFEPKQKGVLLLNNGQESPLATINSLGLRGAAPQLGVRNILVLGDSFTFGAGVGDDETFSARLDSVLGPSLSVINGGQPGYGVFQMEATLRRLVDTLNPELVIAVIWQGDFLRQPLSEEERAQLFRQQRISRILKRSVLVTHMYRMLERLLLRMSGDRFVMHAGEGGKQTVDLDPFLKGLEADQARLRAMHALAKRYGKGLVVVLWPKENFARVPENEVGLAEKLTQQLEIFSHQSGIPFISVQDAMRAAEPNSILLIPGDWHPTPYAHCLAAEAIMKEIPKQAGSPHKDLVCRTHR